MPYEHPNPLNSGSTSLMQTLKRERTQALSSIKKPNAKPGEMRYELMLDALIQMAERVGDLELQVKALKGRR